MNTTGVASKQSKPSDTSKTRGLDYGFVVDPGHLRRLAVVLREVSRTLEFTVTFSDGTTVHYGDIEEIIGQSNSDERCIVSLVADAADEESKSASVILKKVGSPSLEYTIYGNRVEVAYFASQLDNWVAAVRQWYSPFLSSKNRPSAAGLALRGTVVFLSLYGWVSWALGAGRPYKWIAIPVTLLTWLVAYLIQRRFPRGTFSIGQGEERHQSNIYVRNTLIGGLVSSIIGGLIANLISKHL
jgi:hypothetical protein